MLNDVLVSLRNYLLLYQTNVFLPSDIRISENSFGLRLDGEGKCYAVMAFPEYLNEAIIEQAYMRKDFPAEDSVKYFLGVSPNVFRITGFKCYKSLAQKLAVTGALNIPEGYSGLISLPTGGGKEPDFPDNSLSERGWINDSGSPNRISCNGSGASFSENHTDFSGK